MMIRIAASRMLLVVSVAALPMSLACRPSDILSVPPPAGTVSGSGVDAQTSAEAAFYAARQSFTETFVGSGGGIAPSIAEIAGLMTDEMSFRRFSRASYVGLDARRTTMADGFLEDGDNTVQALLADRSALLVSEKPLQQYEIGSGHAKEGEAYALAGYAELFLAEDYCAGVPLSEALPSGGFVYGQPLTTDSLLSVAEAHFDSALAYAAGNDTITSLASVGLARARLGRGHFALAAAAVSSVPSDFVYETWTPTSDGDGLGVPNFYAVGLINGDCGDFTIANQEGGNGLDFLSARDPRLVTDSTLAETCDGTRGLSDSVLYYPLRFGNPSATVPLATGTEARLIEAEAALYASQPDVWLADLNALRNSTCSGSTDASCTIGTAQVPGQPSGLVSLADPVSDTGRISLMFRERAFWLFGTATRLGDLRRLVRQYSRPAESVFPTGLYLPGNDPALSARFPGPITTYGTDVNITLPTPASGITTGNPYYKGCATSTKVA